MRYRHVQKSFLHWILLLIAFVEIGIATLAPIPFGARAALWLGGGVILACALCLTQLKTEDTGDALDVRFGPIWWIGFQLPYDQIRSFSEDRSKWYEGWGLRYTRAGWLYNIQGFDCIRIHTDDGVIRIGTDDLPGLIAMLRERVR